MIMMNIKKLTLAGSILPNQLYNVIIKFFIFFYFDGFSSNKGCHNIPIFMIHAYIFFYFLFNFTCICLILFPFTCCILS